MIFLRFRPEPGKPPDWFIPLIENWTLEIALAVVLLVVVIRLPADAWLALFGDRNKPDKEGKR